jgi:hypothetical protein
MERLCESCKCLNKDTTLEYKQSLRKGDRFYFISPVGEVEELIIYSGISPIGFIVLSKVFKIFTSWEKANEALNDFNNVFTYFKKKNGDN